MNSLRPLATGNGDTTTLAEARRASTWVERFALPITISIMEAQPLALIIAVLTLIFTRTLADIPLGVGEIALLELGLLWWAMFVENRFPTRGRESARLHLVGWLVALAVTVGPLLPSLIRAEEVFPALVDITAVMWLWRRNMYYVQVGFEYGSLATSFKVGFGVLLGILLLVIAFPQLSSLRDALALALPIFFLSGLVTLSLARLGAIRNNRRALASSQADPTCSWLIALTLFAGILTLLVIILESIFSFSSFELTLNALTPLWNALGTLLGWIFYGIIFLIVSPIFYLISWLISLITHHGAASQQPQKVGLQPPPFHQQSQVPAIPPEVLTVGRWVFLMVAFVAVLLLVRTTLRRWFIGSNHEGIEEVREGLDARSLFGERWRAWWNRRRQRIKEDGKLEPLDPSSARARYRELLQALAMTKEDLARTPTETPAEYEARLLPYLRKEISGSQTMTDSDGKSADSLLLDELTHAYTLERYGGRHTDESKRGQMRSWVSRLVMRLTGKASGERSTRR